MQIQSRSNSTTLSRSANHEPAVAIDALGAARRSLLGRSGVIGWGLLWLLGIPLPVLLIIYLIRGH
jgi:hypothetical protein